MLKTLLAGAMMTGMLAVTPIAAQEVKYETLEMHGLWQPQQPEFVQAVYHRKHRRAAKRSYSSQHSRDVVRRPTTEKGAGGFAYDHATHKKRMRVE